MKVRRAHAGDVATIAGFNARMAAETESRALPAALVGAGVAAVVDDPAKGFYLVAEHDGETAGALLITFEWSDWRNAHFWWIQSVYVLPRARRLGVFRALHAFVERAAREAGNVCGLRLYVEQDNDVAQRVYRASGMHDSGYRLYEKEFA